MALPDDGLEVEPSTHSLSLFMEKLAIDWMARLLECPLDPRLSLSSLTRNCYLLGRIAERCEPLGMEAAARVSASGTACAAAATRPRPHREVLRDYVRFQNACHVLRVSSSDLVSLADIQEERAAQRLASCFWTLAQSAQGAGHQGIPPFMTDQERKRLRSHVRRLERSRKSKFESETLSPLKRPGAPSDSAWSLEARRPGTARGEASYAPGDDRHVCQPSPSLEFWRLREQEGSLWAPVPETPRWAEALLTSRSLGPASCPVRDATTSSGALTARAATSEAGASDLFHRREGGKLCGLAPGASARAASEPSGSDDGSLRIKAHDCGRNELTDGGADVRADIAHSTPAQNSSAVTPAVAASTPRSRLSQARARRGGRRRRGVSASPALKRPGKRDVGEASMSPDSPRQTPAHAGRESWAWLAVGGLVALGAAVMALAAAQESSMLPRRGLPAHRHRQRHARAMA